MGLSLQYGGGGCGGGGGSCGSCVPNQLEHPKQKYSSVVRGLSEAQSLLSMESNHWRWKIKQQENRQRSGHLQEELKGKVHLLRRVTENKKPMWRRGPAGSERTVEEHMWGFGNEPWRGVGSQRRELQEDSAGNVKRQRSALWLREEEGRLKKASPRVQSGPWGHQLHRLCVSEATLDYGSLFSNSELAFGSDI